jgi:hypothetical protein
VTRYNGYAVFSECGTYRYELGGDIGAVEPLLVAARTIKPILWVLINPSDADAEEDDPTLRTLVVFSELWGYNRVMVGNLYGYKATVIKDMWQARKSGVDIIGPDNDAHLRQMISVVRRYDGRVMVGWGVPGERARAREVHQMIGEAYCLRTNKDGSPVHPLYQPHRLVPFVWQGVI